MVHNYKYMIKFLYDSFHAHISKAKIIISKIVITKLVLSCNKKERALCCIINIVILKHF